MDLKDKNFSAGPGSWHKPFNLSHDEIFHSSENCILRSFIERHHLWIMKVLNLKALPLWDCADFRLVSMERWVRS